MYINKKIYCLQGKEKRKAGRHTLLIFIPQAFISNYKLKQRIQTINP